MSAPKEVGDQSPKAYDSLVERLLASPHFGERWGRHGLGKARYADSDGYEKDRPRMNAWRYRDWVINSINADLPFDQFTIEQLAGDLLPEPTVSQKIATGFHRTPTCNVEAGVHPEENRVNQVFDRVNTTGTVFLGTTLECAQCHDHKYDAISTADYYSLSGFLQSSDYRQVRFESIEQNRKTAIELAEINTTHQRQIRQLLESRDIRAPDNAPKLTDDSLPEDSVLFDYSTLSHDKFLQDGFIFGLSPRRAGEPYLDSATVQLKISTFGAAVNDPLWNGLESITEGSIQNQSVLTKIPKSGRTLRSPTFELKDGEVHCLVDGTGHIVACVDSHRLVHGPLHQKTVVRFKEGQRWVRLDLDRYVGHRVHLEFIPEADKQIAVRLAVQGLSKNELAALKERLNNSDRKYEEYAKTAEAILNNDAQTETDLSARDIASSWKSEREQLQTTI